MSTPREECPDCAGYLDGHEEDCPRFEGPVGVEALNFYERKAWMEERDGE